MQNITILGATGSIGTQTLQVISENKDKYTVFALSANDNADLLLKQCLEYQPKFAVIVNPQKYADLHRRLKDANSQTELLSGQQALSDISTHSDVDQIIAAIVGGAGLLSIHDAVKAGKRILLANKESLVMTGKLLLDDAKRYGATILPLDSEHNALFQCLPANQGLRLKSLSEAGVSKLVLTGSGGPFRNLPLSELINQTPDQACKHPNWAMGRKISVDSATMMNKGLEYIEASLLFNASPSQLDVIIHPQSIIHSFVQYRDGTSIAQIGHSDMRVPIAYALAYPNRINSGVPDIDLTQFNFSFEPVDDTRYPCLKLAIELSQDEALPAVMNAANEVAVEAFLNHQIKFTEIYQIVTQTLDKTNTIKITSIEDILYLDQQSRHIASQQIKTL